LVGARIFLGANPGDSSQALTGSIAEVVFVRGHLDRAQIQQLEAYLTLRCPSLDTAVPTLGLAAREL